MNLLMVEPTFFDIEYSINPHMLDSTGSLHKINKEKAREQWSDLKTTFENLGAKVSVMDAVKNLPDLVFAANHAVLIDNFIVMGNYFSKFRKEETKHFTEYYLKNNFEIMSNDFLQGELFEGTGDAIWSSDRKRLYAGFGFRSSRKAYDLIKDKFSIEIIPLRLMSENFYHLDTCFTILDETSVAIVEEAFDSYSLKVIDNHFANVIKIDSNEAKNLLAGNGFCFDKKNVVLQAGASDYNKKLKALGFNPIEVDTSEFIKSGGSVFCLKHVTSY